MIFTAILVLIFEPSTSTMCKIMITMKSFEKFWDQLICCYTHSHDGCNAKNQTKKVAKARAH